ncbi:Predicted membrane protein [Mycobacteroides abscessus subsp. abscessus]|nr:Predicted membrane protein [Mycobacteroides abscessus subsp. abscessus]HEO8418258.1 FUSC family protein [Yersinia enterocolitica]
MDTNRWNEKTILVLKIAIGSAIAYQVSKLLGLSHSYLAPLSLILCLQPSLDQSVQFSIRRVIGTIIGVLMTTFIIQYIPLNSWMLGILLLVGTGIAMLFKLNAVILHQVALSILLVFALEKNAGDYGLNRITDTFIGSIIAIFFQLFIFSPNSLKKVVRNYEMLTEKYSDLFLHISAWIESDLSKEKAGEVDRLHKNLLQTIENTQKDLQSATKNIKYTIYNRRNYKKTIYADTKRVEDMKEAYSYLTNIIAILKDWHKVGAISLPEKQQLIKQLVIVENVFCDQRSGRQKEARTTKDKAFILQNPLQVEVQYNKAAIYVEMQKLVDVITKRN